MDGILASTGAFGQCEGPALSKGRSEADDIRIAYHEASHCLIQRLHLGENRHLGGVTIDPGTTFLGMAWSDATYEEVKAADGVVECIEQVQTFCANVQSVAPSAGQSNTCISVSSTSRSDY